MMNVIYDKGLLKKLAPKIIKDNSILTVTEKLIEKHIISNIKFLVYLDRIDEMSESELDIVARELHVDFYDYSMTVSEKRKSCKTSFAIHATKGTKAAVVKVLDIFFDNAEIKQWYEYKGTPGYFRVLINEVVPDTLSKAVERIEDAKKKSQHLEKLIFLSKSNQKFYSGFHMMQGQKMKFYPAKVDFYFKESTLNIKRGLSQYIEETRRK